MSESSYNKDFNYPNKYNTSVQSSTDSSTTYTDNNYLPDFIQPVSNSSQGETDMAVLNDKAEKIAVLKYNGFYVGRYETRKIFNKYY